MPNRSLCELAEDEGLLPEDQAVDLALKMCEVLGRPQLGRPSGRVIHRKLLSVTELNLCGETPFFLRGGADRPGQKPCAGRRALRRQHDSGGPNGLSEPAQPQAALAAPPVDSEHRLLRGLPLTRLGLGGNRIRDLSALYELKLLQALDISDKPVQNLDALSGCPLLNGLDISATGVVSLSALKDIPLRSLKLYDMPGGTDYTALPQCNELGTGCRKTLRKSCWG